MQLYDILNCEKNASRKEIKKRYCEHIKVCQLGCIAYTLNKAYRILKNPETRNVYNTYGDESISILTSDRYHYGFITLCNNMNLLSLFLVICLNLSGIILSNIFSTHLSKLNFLVSLISGVFLLSFLPANLHKIKCIGDTTNLCRMLKIISFQSFMYLFALFNICLDKRYARFFIYTFFINVCFILFIYTTLLSRSITQNRPMKKIILFFICISAGLTKLFIIRKSIVFIGILLFLLTFLCGFHAGFAFSKIMIFSSSCIMLLILTAVYKDCISLISKTLNILLQVLIVYYLMYILYMYLYDELLKVYH